MLIALDEAINDSLLPIQSDDNGKFNDNKTISQMISLSIIMSYLFLQHEAHGSEKKG